MRITRKYLDELTYKIIGCAIEVNKHLGPGLLESLYENCFIHELNLRGLHHQSQKNIPLSYKGLHLDALLRYDVLVEDIIIVELKSVSEFEPIHKAIMLTYMKLLGKPKGITINFNSINIFEHGQQTLVNEFYAKLPVE
jgi:GxxExxY protein